MKLIVLVALFIFTSCSHMMRSGKYIQLNRQIFKPEDLSKIYGIKAEVIRRHNQGRKFIAGEWVFIPTNEGIYADYNKFNNPYYEVIQSGEFIWPVPASKRLSSSYGMRGRKHHDGIDIAAPVGSHILSSKDGVVIYANNKIGGYGKMVIIKHENNVYSVYAHAKKMYVSKGDKVDKGQVIAQVGMTGRTTGPHLHFEIRVGDDPKNPLKFLPGWVKRLARN